MITYSLQEAAAKAAFEQQNDDQAENSNSNDNDNASDASTASTVDDLGEVPIEANCSQLIS